MKLIIGLGNIGDQYARTRHNIGFMVIDELAQTLQADSWKTESKFKAAITRHGDLLFAKPHTMMNLSGEAAQKIMQFYKIAPTDVWVIFDDLDIPFGRLRIRTGGSSSGHQGINSLIQHIGPNFTRVRVGISLNDRTKEPSEMYVLKPFNSEERTALPQVISGSADIITEQLKNELPTETTFDLLA